MIDVTFTQRYEIERRGSRITLLEHTGDQAILAKVGQRFEIEMKETSWSINPEFLKGEDHGTFSNFSKNLTLLVPVLGAEDDHRVHFNVVLTTPHLAIRLPCNRFTSHYRWSILVLHESWYN